jgi:arsenite oxidase small subunit
MVVAGHATESLPQVVLEVEGGDIYAKGILGLVYGKRDNLDTAAA